MRVMPLTKEAIEAGHARVVRKIDTVGARLYKQIPEAKKVIWVEHPSGQHCVLAWFHTHGFTVFDSSELMLIEDSDDVERREFWLNVHVGGEAIAYSDKEQAEENGQFGRIGRAAHVVLERRGDEDWRVVAD